jgi:hypothetical protein
MIMKILLTIKNYILIDKFEFTAAAATVAIAATITKKLVSVYLVTYHCQNDLKNSLLKKTY